MEEDTLYDVSAVVNGERVTVLGAIERHEDAEELKLNLERYFAAEDVKIDIAN